MIKANLCCPIEQVFINRNLVNRPALPGAYRPSSKAESLEVDVLEVFGDTALVLLPNILARSSRTALVSLEYLTE